MPNHHPVSLPSLLASLLVAFPLQAQADASLTVGSGPNEYHSSAIRANVNLFELPLQLDLDHFQANSSGMSEMKESGAGLTWDAAELISAHYRRSTIADGTFDVTGNEGGLSFSLDSLWKSELRTTLNAGYGAFDYVPTTISRAKLASKLSLTQARKSFALTQDITPNLSMYATHDQYEYARYETFNRDLRLLAIVLFRRTANTAKIAFTLVSFPDKTNTLGLSWKPHEKLMLDLSSGKTSTILDQQLKSLRLGADVQVNDRFSFSAGVNRASASAVMTATGKVLQPETNSTYTELTAGWAF